jgi:hypothetical protein
MPFRDWSRMYLAGKNPVPRNGAWQNKYKRVACGHCDPMPNKRVEKLARWFGARVVAQRPGPAWMQVRGWQEVDWALGRTEWTEASRRFRSCS